MRDDLAPPARAHQSFLGALALATAIALGACDEPVDAPVAPVASRAIVLEQNSPATPGPRVIPTARVDPTPDTATPGPATPPPSADHTAAPISPLPTRSPGAPIPGPSASGGLATPGPSASPDPYRRTGLPLDVAVSGPGFLVLSTKANPETVEDLIFSRHGHFKLAGDMAGTLAVFRLRHADYDFPVVGFIEFGSNPAGAPDETSAAAGAQLKTKWGGIETTALALVLDAERNPEAVVKGKLDYTGRLTIGDAAPRGPDGTGLAIYLALAMVANPAGLVPRPGFAGMYRYTPDAGAVQLGVAVSGANRPVGNANLLRTQSLELDTAP